MSLNGVEYASAKAVCTLKEYWLNKEAEHGRRYKFNEVADAIGVHPASISNLYHGRTNRYDDHILGRIAAFFGVKNGDPIPFIELFVVYSDSRSD